MKIATWNVNSLNVRLPQVSDWLAAHQPDILVLQELKLEQDKYPAAAFRMMGWHTAWAGQKTYNGVAIISRHPLQDVQTGLPALPDDPQQRVIAATINGIRVINVYCVNGEALDSPKFAYKRQWFAALTEYVRDQLATSTSPLPTTMCTTRNAGTRKSSVPAKNGNGSPTCSTLGCMTHYGTFTPPARTTHGGIIAARCSPKAWGCALTTC